MIFNSTYRVLSALPHYLLPRSRYIGISAVGDRRQGIRVAAACLRISAHHDTITIHQLHALSAVQRYGVEVRTRLRAFAYGADEMRVLGE